MTFTEFKESLSEVEPVPGLSNLLRALWYDARGDWETSHNITQDDPSKDGSWMHAYLHRKEGDLANAGYWYSRAGRRMPNTSLDDEWEDLVQALL